MVYSGGGGPRRFYHLLPEQCRAFWQGIAGRKDIEGPKEDWLCQLGNPRKIKNLLTIKSWLSGLFSGGGA